MPTIFPPLRLQTKAKPQQGATITNPAGLAVTLLRSGEADALVEAFLHPSPEQIAAARDSPAQSMTYFEAAQIVDSMVSIGRGAQAAIADLPVDEATKEKLRRRFVEVSTSTGAEG